VDEAIELALLELGVDRDEVEVDVVSQGRAGILGIGSEPAKVRVSLIGEGGSHAKAALDVVNNILDAIGVEATPTIRSQGGGDDPAVIDIEGEDAGLIIGRRGETLRAFQFVVNMIVGRQFEDAGSVVVDVEQYRERRQRQVRSMAQRAAERASSSGQSVTMDPMTAADRRVVHMTLEDDRSVMTESSGEGQDRRVTVSPTGERPASMPSSGSRGRRGGGGGAPRRPQVRDDRD
jgi:spoIIIJ-associated protein